MQPPNLQKLPMSGREFDAFVRATRWSATTAFFGPTAGDGVNQALITPLYGAVQIEDFQLVPLFEALRMPRVSQLLADDVGLEKKPKMLCSSAETPDSESIKAGLPGCRSALTYVGARTR
jgi:hypothetical protein